MIYITSSFSNFYKISIIFALTFIANVTFAQTFTAADITGDNGQSFGAAMGDVNGDGYLDIYVANFGQQNNLWINDGNGNFEALNISGDVGNAFDSAAIGDVDGDGDLDIYAPNFNAQNKLWINDGSANFTAMDISGDAGASYKAVMGDLDGDGDLDIYVTNQNQQNKLWINDGSANFTAMDISGDVAAATGATLGDVDGDGDLDIYVTNQSDQQNKLWINNGSANFTARHITGDFGRSYGSTMGDVDGDGDLDIYVANISNQQNKLWINNGSANFTAMDISGDTGGSRDAVIGDFNGDDDLDIYVVNYPGQNKLWINDGSANFTAMDISGDTGNSAAVTSGDVNGDGYLDIYVANYAQQHKLWLQVPPNFTVQFLDYDATILDSQIVVGGSDATTPTTTPTRTGYTFIGWSPSDLTNIRANTDFTAQYVQNFTVRFLDFDSTVLNTQTATSGEDAVAPTVPVRPGYTFIGWSPSDLTNITADTDFVAQYTLIPVSSPGGSGTSIKTRVKNLIAKGDLGAADKIIEQRPQLFEPEDIATDLQKQLADLIKQYRTLTGHDPVITTPILGTRNLTLNDSGTEVELLQRFLTGEGYSIPAGVTGFFGPQTQSTLAKFQSDKSITPARGYYGPMTRVAITKLYTNVTWR